MYIQAERDRHCFTGLLYTVAACPECLETVFMDLDPVHTWWSFLYTVAACPECILETVFMDLDPVHTWWSFLYTVAACPECIRHGSRPSTHSVALPLHCSSLS